MSSVSQMFEVGAIVLGYVGCVASWRRMAKPAKYSYEPMLTIQIVSNTEEGAYTPPESVTLNNRVALLALRQAIDEALKEPEA